MKLYPIGGDQGTILHLLCNLDAPSALISNVLYIQPRLAKTLTARGRDLPLHFCVAATCRRSPIGHRNNHTSIIILLHRYPEAVCKNSGLWSYLGNKVTPLHVAVLCSASPELVELLCRQCPEAKEKTDGDSKTPYDLVVEGRNSLYLDQYDNRLEVLGKLRPGLWNIYFLLPAFASQLICGVVLGQVLALKCKGIGRGVFQLLGLSMAGIGASLVMRFRHEKLGWWRDLPAIESGFDSTAEMATTSADADGSAAQALGKCVICWDDVADHVLLPCGHLCLCASCSVRLVTDLQNKCPVGNCQVKSVHKVYDSSIHCADNN